MPGEGKGKGNSAVAAGNVDQSFVSGSWAAGMALRSLNHGHGHAIIPMTCILALRPTGLLVLCEGNVDCCSCAQGCGAHMADTLARPRRRSDSRQALAYGK